MTHTPWLCSALRLNSSCYAPSIVTLSVNNLNQHKTPRNKTHRNQLQTMLSGYALYFAYGAMQFVNLVFLVGLLMRHHFRVWPRQSNSRPPTAPAPLKFPLDLYLLFFVVSGLVWDNLRVGAAALTSSNPQLLLNMGCAAYYWHEITAAFHYSIAFYIAFRVNDGQMKRKWVGSYVRVFFILLSIALAVYGGIYASSQICPSLTLEPSIGNTIIATAPKGFDIAIAHLFLGSILYILVGACLFVRARHLPFLVLQCVLLPLFAAVPASETYAFYLGNLWEVIWAASFVWVEWWLAENEEEGWGVLERVEREEKEKKEKKKNQVGEEGANTVALTDSKLETAGTPAPIVSVQE